MPEERPTAVRGRTAVRIAAVVAVVLIALAYFLGRATNPSPRDPIADAPGVLMTSSPDPSIGSEESAVTAATEFARIMTGPSGDPDVYIEQMESIAAPQWSERASDLAKNAIQFVRERYGEQGRVEFYPVKYRLRSYSAEQAVVDIWGVVLGSGPKIPGVEESWITGTVNLILLDSEWKVVGQSSEAGPTPELLRTKDTATTEEILNEFNEYSDASNS